MQVRKGEKESWVNAFAMASSSAVAMARVSLSASLLRQVMTRPLRSLMLVAAGEAFAVGGGLGEDRLELEEMDIIRWRRQCNCEIQCWVCVVLWCSVVWSTSVAGMGWRRRSSEWCSVLIK